MIEVMIFDLDGTLIQTERLKAISYAKAAVELCPYTLEEAEVIEAFKEVVGRSRREVAASLVKRFDLGERAEQRMDEFGVSTAWQAYVQVRLNYYEEMLNDPDTLKNNQWSHNMELLEEARRSDCRVALATMSRCSQVQRILEILELQEAFDFVATQDDVESGKPDPEIYELVAAELAVQPAHCLVIEDSPSGVRAALNAGMEVVAVATPFTRARLREVKDLPADRLIESPEQTAAIVHRLVVAADQPHS